MHDLTLLNLYCTFMTRINNKVEGMCKDCSVKHHRNKVQHSDKGRGWWHATIITCRATFRCRNIWGFTCYYFCMLSSSAFAPAYKCCTLWFWYYHEYILQHFKLPSNLITLCNEWFFMVFSLYVTYVPCMGSRGSHIDKAWLIYVIDIIRVHVLLVFTV